MKQSSHMHLYSILPVVHHGVDSYLCLVTAMATWVRDVELILAELCVVPLYREVLGHRRAEC